MGFILQSVVSVKLYWSEINYILVLDFSLSAEFYVICCLILLGIDARLSYL